MGAFGSRGTRTGVFGAFAIQNIITINALYKTILHGFENIGKRRGCVLKPVLPISVFILLNSKETKDGLYTVHLTHI